MSATWNHIAVFRDLGDPVPGDPDHFDRTAAHMRALATQATNVRDDFSSIMLRQATEPFSGEAADAFRELVADTTNVLKVVPDIARQIAETLDDHVWRLRELRKAADSALARAEARWNERNKADADNTQTVARLRSVRTQIAQLRGSVDPVAQAQVVRLEGQASTLSSQSTQFVRQRNSADTALAGFRDLYKIYEEEWHALQQSTASRLHKQDLWSMKDKGGLQKFAEWIFPEAFDFVSSLMHGDIWGAVWAMRDALDKVLMVAGVIVMVALLFVSAGTLAPFLMAIFFMSATKLALDATLFTSKAVNPRTGKPLSALDLLFDAIETGLDAITAGQAKQGIHAAKLGLKPLLTAFAPNLKLTTRVSRLSRAGLPAAIRGGRLAFGYSEAKLLGALETVHQAKSKYGLITEVATKGREGAEWVAGYEPPAYHDPYRQKILEGADKMNDSPWSLSSRRQPILVGPSLTY